MSNLTLDRLKAWLADEANYSGEKHPLEPAPYAYNGLPYSVIRKRFVTANGYQISIQQSGSHYCKDETEVELWACPHSLILMAYGNGEDPYPNVPLEVVAGYIDALESLPPPQPTEGELK